MKKKNNQAAGQKYNVVTGRRTFGEPGDPVFELHSYCKYPMSRNGGEDGLL